MEKNIQISEHVRVEVLEYEPHFDLQQSATVEGGQCSF